MNGDWSFEVKKKGMKNYHLNIKVIHMTYIIDLLKSYDAFCEKQLNSSNFHWNFLLQWAVNHWHYRIIDSSDPKNQFNSLNNYLEWFCELDQAIHKKKLSEKNDSIMNHTLNFCSLIGD